MGLERWPIFHLRKPIHLRRRLSCGWMVSLLALYLSLSLVPPALAWWDCGHHVVAGLAFDRLEETDRRALLTLLQSHPRYPEDFQLPDSIREGTPEADRWRWGAAAYWPDVARKFPVWSRPRWHYQLAATMVVGEAAHVTIPPTPSLPLPRHVSMTTQELHIEQAITLCRQVLLDPRKRPAERAVALCWLLHLYGDAHQPCHAGSLYVASQFPDGDQGGNRILIADRLNLHAFWDSQLGTNTEPRAIWQEVDSIRNNRSLQEGAAKYDAQASPAQWLEESRRIAREFVYSEELRRSLRNRKTDAQGKIEIPDLSHDYLRNAARISRERAMVAALRLEALLKGIGGRLPDGGSHP